MQEVFMKRALLLARKGIGFTSPNPCVGAVIVKGGEIIAEAYHKKAGQDHAEVLAIREVMKKSGIKTVDLEPALFHNAILYVTLEPCSHNGKTPPCAKAIVAAGFKKVCIGMKDPFKKVNGKGIKYLKEHGVEVELCRSGSALADEIRSINQPFIKWAQSGLPYLTMKAGMSLDGKIATCSGESKWISSELSRKHARLERSKCDAVLVGAGTVRADDPELAAHGVYKNKDLIRIVLDAKLGLPLSKRVFRDDNVIVFYTHEANSKAISEFQKAGIDIRKTTSDLAGLKKIFKFLAKRDFQNIYIEGGSDVHGKIFDLSTRSNGLLDRVLFYIAPKLIGGSKSLSVIGGNGVDKISKALNFKNVNFETLGDDIKLEGEINIY
ncbi:MAG: bifunctional diaminohydroxyphosphoribosylaminopyrimidine deaminase/5-amino-6-(5-phosphoribosylamino)uracil reductase RibD [bacterium]|nr:bifunctional diaminohydroxyphosphoribosylaminopyrimidine deaminase/5-amino-6-(5-phosphoribosylamino)uracil reductase RibD [bacterium]